MRHLKRTAKLGRTSEHRNAMLSNLVCSLIKRKRVRTTVAKAKAARSVAEKLVTLGKSGTVHDRRLASARLRQDEEAVKALFDEIAPAQKDRNGGYTRIIRLGGTQGKWAGQRQGDSAKMAIIEWVELPVEEAPEAKAETPKTEEAKPEGEAKPKKAKKASAKKEAEKTEAAPA
jgi:large subunit ribosomal protein L17